MTDDVDPSGLAVLSGAECLRLLEQGGVGRIAIARGEVPTVRPVNFALDGERIVIRTGEGPVWDAAQRRAEASFEIDHISNEDHTAWSVIVTGQLDDRADPGEAVPLQAWTASPKERTVALTMTDVSGRRVPPGQARPAAMPPSTPPRVKPGSSATGPSGASRDIDHWGRSDRVRRVTRRVVRPIYRHWFRVAWEGLDHIPRRGGALLVANHAGAVPVDAALLMHGIEEERGRAVYGLHHDGLRAVPMLGTLLARNGGVVANPANAVRLLNDEKQLLLVFPEGTKGTTKLYRHRYRLARYGRGGFVASAMHAGVPIVPIAVTGTEETMPTLFRVPTGSGPGWPVTLNGMLLGPLGAVVHFPAVITARVLEPIVADDPPGMDTYPTYRVADIAETVRERTQAALHEMVAARRGVWWR